jgi:hypothetical protein
MIDVCEHQSSAQWRFIGSRVLSFFSKSLVTQPVLVHNIKIMQQRHAAQLSSQQSDWCRSIGSAGGGHNNNKNNNTTVLGSAAATKMLRMHQSGKQPPVVSDDEPITDDAAKIQCRNVHFLQLGLYLFNFGVVLLLDGFYIMRFIMVRTTKRLNVAEATASDVETTTKTRTITATRRGDILKLHAEAGITNWTLPFRKLLPGPTLRPHLHRSYQVSKDSATCRVFQESGDAGDHFIATAGNRQHWDDLMAELLGHMPAHAQVRR